MLSERVPGSPPGSAAMQLVGSTVTRYYPAGTLHARRARILEIETLSRLDPIGDCVDARESGARCSLIGNEPERLCRSRAVHGDGRSRVTHPATARRTSSRRPQGSTQSAPVTVPRERARGMLECCCARTAMVSALPQPELADGAHGFPSRRARGQEPDSITMYERSSLGLTKLLVRDVRRL